MNGKFSIRAVAAVAALAATAIIFWLWVLFGSKVMMAMDATTAAPPKPASDGVYTVNVLPVPEHCPKGKPCPH